MKHAKQESTKKTVRKQPGKYASAGNKKGKADFQPAKGKHINGGTSFLREDATPYRTQSAAALENETAPIPENDTAVLDVAPPPGLALETQYADETPSPEKSEALSNIVRLNLEAETRWAGKLRVDSSLTRALVSFQANKGRAVYRWFKYKEAFSAGLIEHLLSKYRITKGILLDPFAGSGTALFAAGGLGMKAEGIELLPIGRTLIATKQLIDLDLMDADVKRLAFWRDERPWRKCKAIKPINEFRITRGAYPAETLDAMGKFLAASEQEGRPSAGGFAFRPALHS